MRTFDVLIIGGGACGCTIAYELTKALLKVAVLDRGAIGQEASWASAGMVGGEACPQRDPWYRLSSVLSGQMYDGYDRELTELTGKAIGYGGAGHMVIARHEEELTELHAKIMTQQAAGIEVKLLDGADARQREPLLPDDVIAAAWLPGGRSLDPRKFTQVIAEAAVMCGATLMPNTQVDGLAWDGDRVVGAGGLRAEVIINAAGAWAGRIDPRMTLPVYPMHGQIMVLEGKPGELRHNLSRAGGHGYVTPRGDGRILVGATHETWGYEKKLTPAGSAQLGAIAQRIAPDLAQKRIIDSWSGLRPASPDGMPTIGLDPRAAGYLWAAGHGAAGMMQIPATAAVMVDLVLGREPRVAIDQLRVKRLLSGEPRNVRGEQFMAV